MTAFSRISLLCLALLLFACATPAPSPRVPAPELNIELIGHRPPG